MCRPCLSVTVNTTFTSLVVVRILGISDPAGRVCSCVLAAEGCCSGFSSELAGAGGACESCGGLVDGEATADTIGRPRAKATKTSPRALFRKAFFQKCFIQPHYIRRSTILIPCR